MAWLAWLVPTALLILWCASLQYSYKPFSQSMHHVMADKPSSQLLHCIFLSAKLLPHSFRLPKISTKRLMLKLVGTDDISSRGSGARHNGQQTIDAIFLFDSILFSIYCLQNVCKHGMVFGSVNNSPQMEQVISSSICFHFFSTPPLAIFVKWSIYNIPFSGVFSRGKIFTNFTNQRPFVKIYPRNISVANLLKIYVVC